MSELAAIYQRALGAYLGLALGDALGATVEFMTAEEIAERYGVHDEIIGGGWLDLPRGSVTDDTEMSLALGDAILSRAGFNRRAAADAFAAWLRSGPRDVGHTCRRGIRRYILEGTESASPSDSHGGNGALMRNLPVVLSTLGDAAARREHTLAQCHITHVHRYSDAAALSLGTMLERLVLGEPFDAVEHAARELVAEHPAFAYEGYSGPAGGYVVETTCTVLRAFFEARDYESCVTATVNRGGDADTTGAIAGMLAGARFGHAALPRRWLGRLDPAIHERIARQTRGLLALAPAFSMHARRRRQ